MVSWGGSLKTQNKIYFHTSLHVCPLFRGSCFTPSKLPYQYSTKNSIMIKLMVELPTICRFFSCFFLSLSLLFIFFSIHPECTNKTAFVAMNRVCRIGHPLHSTQFLHQEGLSNCDASLFSHFTILFSIEMMIAPILKVTCFL